VTRLPKLKREEFEGGGRFRKPSWGTSGAGRLKCHNPGGGGSALADNLMRLGMGIIAGSSLTVWLLVGTPEVAEIHHGDLGHPAWSGAIQGFGLAVVVCVIASFRLRKAAREVPWRATFGASGAAAFWVLGSMAFR